ncbi:MAG TPA: dUTP diphosphatase [Actinomycetota bacterium]|nr:dUTP diphosphatase [Actinomycetota bacterium]
MDVLLRQLDPLLPIPRPADSCDAGIDICARNDARVKARGGREVIATGIAIALPEGSVALVTPRSGIAALRGVTVLNAPGVIDPGYRGEIKVVLVNHDPSDDFVIHRGDRIAQLLFLRAEKVLFQRVAELPPSSRGARAFGSSGVGLSDGSGDHGGGSLD